MVAKRCGLRAIIDAAGRWCSRGAERRSTGSPMPACRLIAAPEPTERRGLDRRYAAIVALCDGVFGAAAATPDTLSVPIARAQGFVGTHLGEPLGVERLAAGGGPQPGAFRQEIQRRGRPQPLGLRVREQRMERATRLLRRRLSQPVNAIAAATGFATGNYFAKAFRRARGQCYGAVSASATGAQPG